MKFFILKKELRLQYLNKNLKLKGNKLINFLSNRFYIKERLNYLFNKSIFGMGTNYLIKKMIAKYGLSLYNNIFLIKNNFLNKFTKMYRFFLVNVEKVNEINDNLALKRSLGLYSARRMLLSLPSRGQRSKTNAGTAKSRTKYFL